MLLNKKHINRSETSRYMKISLEFEVPVKTKVYLEPSRKSMMEAFCKIAVVNGFKLITIFAKKAPSLISDWVLNEPLKDFEFLLSTS